MKVMALDFGAARTGVAVSDPTGIIARPLCVVERVRTDAGRAELVRIVGEEQPEQVIVGLPLTLRGVRGEQARETEEFAEEQSRAYREAFGADRRYFEKNSPWTLAEENASKVRDRTRFRVIAGTLDPLYHGNRDFARLLEKQGIRVDFLPVEGIVL